MIKLLLIADDFTGALDTGVQFAGQGARTKIVIGKEADQLQLEQENADIIVIDAETRHLPREEAYRTVVRLAAKALKENVPYILKKTDSALRGNIGMELAALLEVSGENFLPFIPALPSMNRITRDGVHYIEGVPIANTVFGKDPFEPVISSHLKDLFRDTQVHTEILRKTKEYNTEFGKPTIGIFDADTMEDIEHIAECLKSQGKLRIMAGCAGVASVLSGFIDITADKTEKPQLENPLLVVCGSLNPISKKQIEYGVKMGYPCFVMDKEIKMQDGYVDSTKGQAWIASVKKALSLFRMVMIDTGEREEKEAEEDSARVKIAGMLGETVKRLVSNGPCNTVMIIGGDTLLGFVEQSGCREITLIDEIKPGTVLSSMMISDRKIWVLSKSGGFGDENLLTEVSEELIS